MSQGHTLTEARVEGLFGRFYHRVPFPADDSFVIVHGPNGVGKTKLLELIGAVAWPVNFVDLARTPFKLLELRFSDDSALQVEKNPTDPAPGNTLDHPLDPGLRFKLHLAGQRLPINWSPKIKGRSDDSLGHLLRLSARNTAALSGRDRELRNALLHGAGEYDLFALADEWPEELRERLQELLGAPAPEALREFLGSLTVHFIDTHRLLGLNSTEGQGKLRPRPASIKVEEYSKDLSRRLAKALEDNSRTSQELDRTYPRRLLQEPEVEASEQDIRDRYAAQEEMRRRLGDIALVDEQDGDIEIPREMESWQRAVLWTYLRDTQDKLDTFKVVLDRVSLLRDIVNRHFLFKNLEIDRDRGFRIVSDEGQELPLSSLSSGEQHELVLTYDLLFNVGPDALVLIDEPEISLHVSWQKAFIKDLQSIAKLVKFRTIVATHSPQIAGKWADRMVVLGPDAE